MSKKWVIEVKRTTVSGIFGKKDAIETPIQAGVPSKRMKLKPSHHSKLDDGMLMWLKQARGQNMSVGGDLIKEKSLKLAELMHITNFMESNPWLDNFKKRHGITFQTVQGEAGAVDSQAKDHSSGGGKYSGSEKFLFWRSAVPRNLVPSRKKEILVKYKTNSKAWMTAKLFEEVLREWNRRLGQQGRSMLLCLDTFSGHPEIQLENIKLVFFPPNTKANSQPIDQGIIEDLKRHYKKILLRRRPRGHGHGKGVRVHIARRCIPFAVLGSRSASRRSETAS
uniref:LOW QUALITY PROTEIN: tigger transposable element-derived protein 4-like n=1 Tax=Styela clava TaxID=7725 RepID=UPI001939AB04|nr:LOW QUALITY PROTEIN: tigger transposable element-derived protein 4-like [Styela clava]